MDRIRMNAALRQIAQFESPVTEKQEIQKQAEYYVTWTDEAQSSLLKSDVSMIPSIRRGPLISTWGQQQIVGKGRKGVAMEMGQSIRMKTQRRKRGHFAKTKAQRDGMPDPPFGNPDLPATVSDFRGRDCWPEYRFVYLGGRAMLGNNL